MRRRRAISNALEAESGDSQKSKKVSADFLSVFQTLFIY